MENIKRQSRKFVKKWITENIEINNIRISRGKFKSNQKQSKVGNKTISNMKDIRTIKLWENLVK